MAAATKRHRIESDGYFSETYTLKAEGLRLRRLQLLCFLYDSFEYFA
jgi:hypothetical protein